MGEEDRVELLKSRLGELELIGLTGSTTKVTEAPLILLEGMETKVREEDIVLIVNRSSSDYILAVCRSGMGVNENLRVGGYSPGIAYVRSKGQAPSTAKESYHFTLSFIGLLTGQGVKTNNIIVAPGSQVYLFKRERMELNPLMFLRPRECVSGGYLANSEGNWPIPFDLNFIPYHIGVFGATGSGKSRLARHLLIPVLKEAGYGVLVFDWEGVDYSPFFEKEVISICNFKMDAPTAVEFILRNADNFGYKEEKNPISEAIIGLVSKREEDGTWWDTVSKHVKDGKELREKLREEALNVLRERKGWEEYGNFWELKFDSGLNKISGENWELLYRSSKGIRVEEFKFPESGQLIVIDMSEVSSELKLSFFSELCGRLISVMRERGVKLNLALIIDEAPQYCPSEPRGLQNKTTEQLKDLCALGRKRNLCVVLLSQGMAGEIGINAAVRRNLNTLFIGQIHPLDIEEAGKRLMPYGVRAEELLFLEPGKFYLTGKMNPSPTPLLISFKID
ncbi:MAG: ATP-binding protein [Candidatus Brockarchaeota archaeon]|nr:ATP-binding protein [Candidatus Brockarchaeota archaeon]